MNDVINRKDTIGAILSIEHIAELSDGDAVIRVSAVNYVLRNLPSADVMPVVRCKDCKNSYVFEPWEGINATRYCKIFKNHYGDSDFCVNDDDFCSYGERKDG